MKGSQIKKEITDRLAAHFGLSGFLPIKGNLSRPQNPNGVAIEIEFSTAQRQGHVHVEPFMHVYWREFATAFYDFECEQRQQYPLTKPARNHPVLTMQFRSLLQLIEGRNLDALCVSDFSDLDAVSSFLIETYDHAVLLTADKLSTPQGILEWSIEHARTTGAWGTFAMVLLLKAVRGTDAARAWAQARLENRLMPFEADCLRFLMLRMPVH